MGLFLLTALFLFPAFFFPQQPFRPFRHILIRSLRFFRDLAEGFLLGRCAARSRRTTHRRQDVP